MATDQIITKKNKNSSPHEAEYKFVVKEMKKIADGISSIWYPNESEKKQIKKPINTMIKYSGQILNILLKIKFLYEKTLAFWFIKAGHVIRNPDNTKK